MTGAESRFSIRGHSPLRMLLPPVLVIGALAAALFFFDDSPGEEVLRDADLCPVDRERITGSVMFLFDFTKPLDPFRATLPGDLLRDRLRVLGRDTEVQVFSLADSPSAPRALLKRLCKPFDNDDLPERTNEADSGKQRAATRGCEALPAHPAEQVSQSATRFCIARDALQDDLNTLAGDGWPEDENVANAYLVEALEDVRLEFAERPGPNLLYVFSDMMQHAPWYSHLDLDWTDWDYDDFAELLESRNWLFRQRNNSAGMQAEIFYVPRRGTTDRPEARELHQDFWRNYFSGAEIAFHRQAPMPAYTAMPLMNVPTEAEIAARERAAIEQLLREIQQQQQALNREQRELEVERQRQAEAQIQRLEERQRQLERRQLAEAARQREESEAQARRRRELLVEQQAAAAAAPAQRAEAEALQMPEAETGPCGLIVPATIASLSPEYPRRGRMDFGDARITVRYVLDETGATVDDEVTVVRESSSADRRRYFDLFARAALEKVRNWAFTFAEPDDESCRRRQVRSTSFEFNYN